MTTTQGPRNPRQSTPPNGPNPARSGLILIAVGVVLAVILLVKAGGAGFDSNATAVKIGKGEEKVTTTTEATTTTVAEQAPQTVQVVAANGSGASGMAAKAAAILAQSGYTQVVSTNSVQPVTASSVMYATGYDANARAIAKALGLPDTAVQPLAAGAQVAKDQPATSGVIVMIGPDLTQTLNSAGAATTTTVAGAGGTGTTVKGATTTTVKGTTGTTVKGTTGTTVKGTTTTVKSGTATLKAPSGVTTTTAKSTGA